MQILHLTGESEVRPRHQARTPQKKADIQNRPMRTTHLAPRYHPISKQADEGARLDYFNAHNTTCTNLGPAQGAEHKCLPEQVIRDSHSPPRRAQALRPDPPVDSGTGRYEVSASSTTLGTLGDALLGLGWCPSGCLFSEDKVSAQICEAIDINLSNTQMIAPSCATTTIKQPDPMVKIKTSQPIQGKSAEPPQGAMTDTLAPTLALADARAKMEAAELALDALDAHHSGRAGAMPWCEHFDGISVEWQWTEMGRTTVESSLILHG